MTAPPALSAAPPLQTFTPADISGRALLTDPYALAGVTTASVMMNYRWVWFGACHCRVSTTPTG